MSIKLAVIVNRFPTLSETFIYNKVAGLRQAGFDVEVIVQQTNDDLALFHDPVDDPISGYVRPSMTAGSGPGIAGKLFKYFFLHPVRSVQLLLQSISLHGGRRKSIRAWLMALPLSLGNYQVIHFEFSGIAVAYLDSLPLLQPAKLVTSCRGAAEQILPLTNPDRAIQLRTLFPLLDMVHCVSHDMRQTISQYGQLPEKTFVNYPSIDTQKFRRKSQYPDRNEGPYRLISVSRLHWKKGLEYAILAIKILIDRGYDVRYQIIGAGDEAERLRFIIADLGLEDRVDLVGRLPAQDVQGALETADVFLLPSLSEGVSNSALEAMAMEIPVVSTSVGGMPEAITDGVEGLLVQARDPVQLADKVAVLLQRVDKRQSMGKLGRERVIGQFNLSNQICVFVEKYRSIVSD